MPGPLIELDFKVELDRFWTMDFKSSQTKLYHGMPNSYNFSDIRIECRTGTSSQDAELHSLLRHSDWMLYRKNNWSRHLGWMSDFTNFSDIRTECRTGKQLNWTSSLDVELHQLLRHSDWMSNRKSTNLDISTGCRATLTSQTFELNVVPENN